MPMWYVFGTKYNENYHQGIDDHLQLMSQPLAAQPDSSITEARTHGNPFYDQTTIIWQVDSSIMGKQMNMYGGEHEVRAEGQAAPSGYGFKELFEEMPGMEDQNGSFHVIDIDDPELVEHGEAYIHHQLTSYVADPLRDRSAIPDDSMWQYVGNYLDTLVVNGISEGWNDGLAGVILKPVRQRLGFPSAEWLGAPID